MGISARLNVQHAKADLCARQPLMLHEQWLLHSDFLWLHVVNSRGPLCAVDLYSLKQALRPCLLFPIHGTLEKVALA